MNGGGAPALHALDAEPRSARPGESVRLRFRTRNLAGSPSPAARLRFVLDAGLEPLGDTTVAIAPVAPGALLEASLDAVVAASPEDGAPLAARAVLELPGATIASNVRAITIATRPLLDGAGSGVVVERADGDRLRVVGTVANAGDGAAHDVRLTVPAPSGTLREAGDPETLAVARLAPGAVATLRYDATIVAPRTRYAVDDATVCCAETSCALASRAEVVPEPELGAPEVRASGARGRVAIAIALPNDGWADARDVSVRVELPPGARLIPGTATVDDVAVSPRAPRARPYEPHARIAIERETIVFAVRLVEARERATIAFVATLPVATARPALRVVAGAHAIEVPCDPAPARALRLRLADAPASLARGDTATVAIECANLGDVDERPAILVEDGALEPPPATLLPAPLRPGEVATLRLPIRASDERAALAIVARDGDEERARLTIPVAPRGVAAPAAAAPDAALAAALDAPERALAGAAIPVALRVVVDAQVARLVVRVSDLPDAEVVAASSTVDGRALLDAAGRSPFAPPGLAFHDVGPGTTLVAGWSLRAPAARDTPLAVSVELEADGARIAIPPLAIAIDEPGRFASSAAGLGYAVDAHFADPARDDPATDAPDAEAGAAQLDALAATLHGGETLVAHVVGLRGLVDGDDARSRAVRDFLDRLAVKLRIPGFAPLDEDLDEPALRLALAVDEPGPAAVLRAIVAGLPARCDAAPRAGEALARYRALLEAELTAAAPGADGDAGYALADARTALRFALGRRVAGAA